MKTTIKTIAFILALMLSFSSCKKDEDTGTVNVKVTDAPFPFKFVKEAKINISKIELKSTDGEYVTVFEGNYSINLVDYRNGTTADLTVETIPIGTYQKIKVTVDNAEITLSNDVSFTIDPANDGYVETMINPQLVVEESQEEQLLLDIDLSDSFEFRGTFLGGWITAVTQITGINSFNPDIRVANLTATGSIEGIVKDDDGNPVEGAEVYVKYDYNGDGILDKVSTVTENDGTYKIIGLPAMDFTLTVETEHAIVNKNVSVTVNHTVNINIDLQP